MRRRREGASQSVGIFQNDLFGNWKSPFDLIFDADFKNVFTFPLLPISSQVLDEKLPDLINYLRASFTPPLPYPGEISLKLSNKVLIFNAIL